jgi:multicomponent Na+:H+ antiporter subunit A
MLVILLAHAVAAALAPVLVRRWGRLAFYPLALTPLTSLVWVGLNWPSSQHDHRVEVPWIPELSMNIALRFDSLAAIMSVLVLGVGTLVLCYCAEYFHHHDGHPENRLPSFAAELVAFSGTMFGLVVADNMLVLYAFWELTTVLSFLLIGHYAERLTSRRAAIQALLVTTAGGLAMLAGIVVLGHAAGSYLLSDLVTAPPSGVAVSVAVLLVLVGALSKSAIVPLHFWLPGAMAAPTPVSAYLHAAAMVKAGVYLIARMAPGFAATPGWRPTVVTLGLVTMVLAGWRAVREYDLKLILAFGTVSQLGLITVLVGMGDRDLMLAGLAVLYAHAIFKAALFMVVGIIDHATGTRDVRRLAGLGRRCPSLLLIAATAAASMAALPPFVGFVAKEASFATLPYSPSLGAAAPWVLAVIATGSVFTMIYSLRFVWGAFAGKGRRDPSGPVAGSHRPTAAFLTAPTILAAAGLLLGLAPGRLNQLLGSYTGTNQAGYQLALWHGSDALGALPLALSALVTLLGVAAFFSRTRLRRARVGWLPLGNADRAYYATVRGLDVLSVRLTAITQRGSIPATQSVILSTLVLVSTAALTLGARNRPELRLWDSPRQAILAGLLLAAALGATATRNRLAAVLMVGVTGYACGAVFAFHGAPDLALTQFLVETVTLVIFVLVLRTLPADVDDIKRHRLPRVVLALSVGAAVTALAVFAIAARTGTRIASLLPDAAYLRGHGANTVNVLLVDVRAWDTLGEISVLLVAATGVTSLVFRHRRFGLAPRIPQNGQPAGQPDIGHIPVTPYSPAVSDTTWLRGSEYRDPRYRSLVLEVTTRIIFPLIMVVSVYFFFTGHNTPGGGFAGGLTAGLALVLRYLAGGPYELGETLPLDAGKILGVGLGLSAATAVTSLLFGAPVLSSAVVEFDIPILGHFTFVTALFFDLGVYLIVVGLVLDVLRSLGARVDQELADATIRQGAR